MPTPSLRSPAVRRMLLLGLSGHRRVVLLALHGLLGLRWAVVANEEQFALYSDDNARAAVGEGAWLPSSVDHPCVVISALFGVCFSSESLGTCKDDRVEVAGLLVNLSLSVGRRRQRIEKQQSEGGRPCRRHAGLRPAMCVATYSVIAV
eukprot:4707577-Pyramimonas_sp.AAC.2